jgi:hypothetical protein
MSDYVIAIPTYNRPNEILNKTLNTLRRHNIDTNLIHVFVANQEQYDEYNEIIDKSFYNKIIIGVIGLVHQREFISNYFKLDKYIVFLDDDVELIDLTLSPLFREHNLDYFINHAFAECEKQGSYIWGVYAVFNPFFRSARIEVTTDLNYIVGCIYGIINRPYLEEIKLTITANDGNKEDVERTVRYFIHDGIVLRFNKIGFKTKYYGKSGGLGTLKQRLLPMMNASLSLKHEFSDYGKLKIRKSGMYEFALKKLPEHKNKIKREYIDAFKKESKEACAEETRAEEKGSPSTETETITACCC